jgi:hypothetical protein
MYWSISGKCILHLLRSSHARCWSCESVKCSKNSWTNVSHVNWMSSSTGSRESIQVPMSLTQVATLGPWMRVSAMDTLRMGELRPGTLALARKYPSMESRNVLASLCSPSNIWGRFPITLSLAFLLLGLPQVLLQGVPEVLLVLRVRRVLQVLQVR